VLFYLSARTCPGNHCGSFAAFGQDRSWPTFAPNPNQAAKQSCKISPAGRVKGNNNSRQDFIDHAAMHIGKTEISSGVTVCQTLVVDPQSMEDRRL
jgi:hypothetical protein